MCVEIAKKKDFMKSVKKQLFQLYCLKSFSAEVFWDPQRILAKLSDISTYY